MEPKRIREGYLVKRGSMFNTWKPMWVVLLEDGIEFYKKKSDNSPKGMIPLKGSTLTSPCQDFGKRMFVFKITTTKQQDHFFQAAFLEERDAWVRDIKKAIKCIEGGQKFARKSTRRSIRLPETIDLGALYLSMRDTEKGVKELNLEKDKKIFNHCFTGNCVIDWLVSNKSVRNRQEGLVIASSLLNEGYLQPAGDLSKTAVDGTAENPFLDNPDAFYYFPDSGFFCEENSSDDDVILKEEFRGVIIKQGCLLKQGEDPLGVIRLRGCVVTSVESNPDGKKSEEENLFEIITADEVHYFLQAAAPKERTEWIKAIQAAFRTGK
ncbi:pleckstrin isoform X2 [Physeter macrocephalus]|uniref:Pleckstrin isoform X2 n=1 Tax=Physeter macrocephalus TaxID=9755 RepID=A0A455C8R4_PHYMC|nr:pleckstrin isoform X2 [Physeter catodon]|eukprot:XP_028352596.1 pleckstrin isoform X3 [Physeter catodon]